jgi:lipoprotein-releasing system ATP-binding protein
MSVATTQSGAGRPTSSGSGRAIIEARDVHKTYRLGKVDVPVLRGVSFALEPGECVGVLGASGSGKSTLLHLLGGLDRPDAGKGEVVFEGRALSAFDQGELDRYRNTAVGFVFQFYHLLPELNVLQNTSLGSMIGRRSRGEVASARDRAADLLERFGLAHRLRHRPSELSGGERQRVAIARALINAPRLLLADEPTGNLDRETGATILDTLMQVREELGQAIVLVTHDEATAQRADRVVRIADGRVEGTPPA